MRASAVRSATALVATITLFAIGCASMDAKMERFRAENRTNLMRLSRGMPRDSALTAMGLKTVEISNKWEVGIANTQAHRTAVLSNPFRTETLASDKDTLEVLYYYTDVKRQDGAITDDELTPLVFKSGRLIGWGQGFLGESIQKYEIRVR